MARQNNKFSLLNSLLAEGNNECDSDNDSHDNIKNNINNINNKVSEKTILQEEEEIQNALKNQANKPKRLRKKQEVTQETKPEVIQETKPEVTQETKSEETWTVTEKPERRYTAPIRDDKLLENKEIYNENKTYGDLGDDKKLNSYWTVWVHRTSCTDWKITGYQKVYVINSIGSFWRFFNNFQMLNTYQNNIFIMRDEIAPIWEDVNNKFGGICSLKIDSTQRGLKTDLSTEIFTILSLLIMNETFVTNNKNINGISFGVKKRSSLIKIWTKTYDESQDFLKELPVPLLNKFNVEMQKQSKSVLNNDGKISIQFKQIKPEYEL